MKIVDEIATAIGHGDGDWFTITVCRDELNSILAAKLMPIRDALHMMWDNPEAMTPSDMLAQYTAACEMLDEEA